MPATVIVGAQWGDEGKGKIVDLLALDSDVVCRYQGGPNAGHTIVLGGETFALHHVPSGILSGKLCVVGAGCVVDPGLLVAELDELEGRGIATQTVRVSGNAHLIMPWHVAIDSASERHLGRLQIGTTRRGIGPAYADKAARIGIRVQDILDPKILRQKFETALAEKNVVLERVHGVPPLEVEELAERMEAYAVRLRPYVDDTSLLVARALRDNRRVLLEGAQGTLLDLDHGTYPFVTSSSPIAGAAATGVGIGPTRIDRVLGVAKAYVTRVGEGPFPTEIEGPEQDRARAPLRVARPGGAPLRRARQRDDEPGADEDRRPFRVRRAPRVRALPPPRWLRDRGVPRPPERLPPCRARLRDAGRLAGAARRGRVHGRPAGGGARLRRLRRGRARD